MKKRSFSYMLLAIVIGYLLISAVPEQVEKLVYPKLLYKESPTRLSQDDPFLNTEPPVASKEESSKVDEDVPAAESTGKGDEKPDSLLEDNSTELVIEGSNENFSSLYMWFVLDILIALGAYFVARRLLT